MSRYRRTTSLLTTAALALGGIGVLGRDVGSRHDAATTSLGARAEPRADVPTPEEFFGFPMGATGRLPDFASVKSYLEDVAEASPGSAITPP